MIAESSGHTKDIRSERETEKDKSERKIISLSYKEKKAVGDWGWLGWAGLIR